MMVIVVAAALCSLDVYMAGEMELKLSIKCNPLLDCGGETTCSH